MAQEETFKQQVARERNTLSRADIGYATTALNTSRNNIEAIALLRRMKRWSVSKATAAIKVACSMQAATAE